MRRGKKNVNKNKKVKMLVFVILVTILLAILGTGYYFYAETLKDSETVAMITEEEIEEVVEEVKVKELQTFVGNERPIAVMLDNNRDAWPQIGLNSAYMVYEIIVEGGETRLMALFKGVDLEQIGAVRSARPYFLDYALEHDAIYVHFGGSEQALSDIGTLSVRSINGIYEDGTTFWRSQYRYAPHNAMTSIQNIYESAVAKNYNTESDVESILTYTVEEVLLEEAEDALEVVIPHSDLQTVAYKYNEETMMYERYARGVEQLDGETSEGVQMKNIIIQLTNNYTVDSYGRQGLYNTGEFDGYYITNGKVIPIKCEKVSRTSQTVYKDLDGNELIVNDGNTFVNICSKTANVQFN